MPYFGCCGSKGSMCPLTWKMRSLRRLSSCVWITISYLHRSWGIFTSFKGNIWTFCQWRGLWDYIWCYEWKLRMYRQGNKMWMKIEFSLSRGKTTWWEKNLVGNWWEMVRISHCGGKFPTISHQFPTISHRFPTNDGKFPTNFPPKTMEKNWKNGRFGKFWNSTSSDFFRLIFYIWAYLSQNSSILCTFIWENGIFDNFVYFWQGSVTINALPWHQWPSYIHILYIFVKVLMQASKFRKQKWKILLLKKVMTV